MNTPIDRTPPSGLSAILATAILAAVGGYFIGQGISLGIFSPRSRRAGKKSTKKSWPNSYDVTVHPDSSDEELMENLKGAEGTSDEEVDDDGEDQDIHVEESGGLEEFNGNKEECKLVLVVRTDLGMGKGASLQIFFHDA